jgi:hypothetical protein
MKIPQREIQPFDEADVLRVLRETGRPLAWSVIAAKILGLERSEVTMPQVRGVRDACKALESQGLVARPSKYKMGVHTAVEQVAAMRER